LFFCVCFFDWTVTSQGDNIFKTVAGKQHSPRRRIRGAAKTPKKVRYRIALAADLAPGESMKFLMPIAGVEEECFVINYQGSFHAYVNRCRHVPMAMDWVDNQFFTEQSRYLMCQTHNAYYQPDSGECIAGPPGTCGKFLHRVPLEIVGGVIYAQSPREKLEDD
jgi:nitrite reductase/ring-hydroxylating ferredoxin subunit